MDIQETIARARQLRQDDDLEASQELLLALLNEHQDNALVLYEVGGSYDVLGEEKDAIPYYRQSLDAGLAGADRLECLVCLGICYRNVGQFVRAVDVLETAVEEFPNDNGAAAFLALAYYSHGREDEAVGLLLDLLLTTTRDETILAYADTLDFYKDHLDEIWND